MPQTDVLIIGSGVAGCAAAYALAKEGTQVTLLSSEEEEKGACPYGPQAGIVYSAPGDTPGSLAEDLEKAGEGYSYSRAVEQLVTQGSALVEEWLFNELEIDFDRNADGQLIYYSDPHHSRARVIKKGETTGVAIRESLLLKLAAFPHVQILKGYTAVDLITLERHSLKSHDVYRKPTCLGAYVAHEGQVEPYLAKETILATGGLGQLFPYTTNPKGARGEGVALAGRAGARLLNLHRIQFHPTTLHMNREEPIPLSDVLRQEGAELLDVEMRPFMGRYHEKAGQAPYEEVARGAYLEMLQSQADHLWLDCSRRDPDWLRDHFTSLYERLNQRNLDITREPIPVVPAAHFCCGGVAVDKVGQSSLQRLRAVGETACTGVHGLKRQESTSLLESLVWAQACAQDINSQLKRFVYYFPSVAPWKQGSEPVDTAKLRQDWAAIRQTMWEYGGLYRSKDKLQFALNTLRQLAGETHGLASRSHPSAELFQLRNAVDASVEVLRAMEATD